MQSQEEFEHEYERVDVNGLCPECGHRDITKLVAVDGPPVPYERQATCHDCDHVDDPLAFSHERVWDELSKRERELAERARGIHESKMIEYEYSAHAISTKREP